MNYKAGFVRLLYWLNYSIIPIEWNKLFNIKNLHQYCNNKNGALQSDRSFYYVNNKNKKPGKAATNPGDMGKEIRRFPHA
ncbi:hypothetical protein BMT72_11425 [Escherichia coli]|nr:hypothetical protein BMT75_21485 [Escherichia coli]OOJ49047.1 hypothetical protein BMT72_11425 [Escherichia coli]RVE02292.1 hypothetical protein CIC18_02215 [Escherichia coli]